MFTLRTKLSLIKALMTRRSPIYVQYALTKQCNLKCGMCHSTISRRKESELALPEIDRLAGILGRLGTGVVVITGGEPFMRSDLPEVIRLFTRRGMTVRLQTNGVLASEDRIRACMDAGLREVTVSLDSLVPEKQDAINGRPGAWKEIMAAISRFSTLLPRRNAMLGINTVVSKMNIDEIPGIIEFATALSSRFIASRGRAGSSSGRRRRISPLKLKITRKSMICFRPCSK
jgi:MoaA/NifB/PqqE/SkfB family radical SAM enzyme